MSEDTSIFDTRFVAAHVFMLLGIALVGLGAGLVYAPAGIMAIGVGLTIYGFILGLE